MKLTHVRLLVDDVDACVAFYREVLGFEVGLDTGDGAYCELDAGDVILALFRRDLMETSWLGRGRSGPAPQGDSAVLCIAVSDVDAAYEKMRAAGAAFVTEPRDQTQAYIRAAHLRDPAGNLVEINHSLFEG